MSPDGGRAATLKAMKAMADNMMQISAKLDTEATRITTMMSILHLADRTLGSNADARSGADLMDHLRVSGGIKKEDLARMLLSRLE